MSFGRFLSVLRARFGLIVLMTSIGVIVAAAVTLAMPKRYYSETTAVLDQPLPENAAAAMGGAAGISYFLATQRDVVASRTVATRVIQSLDLERDPEKARRLIGGDNVFMYAISMVRGAISSLFASGDERPASVHEWLIENVLKSLSVSSGRDSRLLRVGFMSSDPEFSAAAANATMRAFLEVNVHLKSAPARSETAWLDGQLKELRENLAQAEAKLSAFQQSKGIIATDERLDSENLRLADLSAQLASAQADSYASEARRRQLADFASRGKASDAPAEVVTSAVVMRLREDIAQREARLADMSRDLGPNHPKYKAAAGELDQLRGQLGTEMRSVAQGLASQGQISGSREAGLRSALERQKGRLLGMKRDREQVTMLARDVDNAQRSYNSAVQRVSQARIEAASERPNASLVDEAAVPLKPASPRTMLNLALGCGIGLLLGLGLALQFESSQRQVRTGDDLAEVLGVPILAVLPPRALRGPAMRALAADNVVALPKA